MLDLATIEADAWKLAISRSSDISSLSEELKHFAKGCMLIGIEAAIIAVNKEYGEQQWRPNRTQ